MQTKTLEIKKKVSAIIMFGPPTDYSGMGAATYYQVTLDPNMVSPSGHFIRFDQGFQGGEMHGWQRIECLTVCEVLSDAADYAQQVPGYVVDPEAVLYMAEIDYG